MDNIHAKVLRSYYVRLVILGIFSFGIGFLLMGFEYIRWGKIFDPSGVTRMDGKKFLWQDIKEIRPVYMVSKYGAQGPLNHYELIFTEGKAFIFPLMLENSDEILLLVSKYTSKPIPE